jgi:hypothetical protein
VINQEPTFHYSCVRSIEEQHWRRGGGATRLQCIALVASCVLGLSMTPLSSVRAAAVSSADGGIHGRVQLERRGRRLRSSEGAIVWLEGVPETLPDTSNLVHEVRLYEKGFVPQVSVVLVGTMLSFPNDDRVYHNPFSTSTGAEFDLGLYGGGDTGMYKTTRPGTIDVHCNVHEYAVAKVFVLTTTRWATSAPDGTFAIEGVPPGTYTFVASAPWGETTHGRVRVRAGRSAQVEVELEVGRPPRHRRKDGSAYDEDV